MSGAFHDREVSEKVALSGSDVLSVDRGDVLVGQGGKYLHPQLFRSTRTDDSLEEEAD